MRCILELKLRMNDNISVVESVTLPDEGDDIVLQNYTNQPQMETASKAGDAAATYSMEPIITGTR